MESQKLTILILQMISLFIQDISSVAIESDVLSRLYKKAVKDNRPLILVLDNESYGKVGQKRKKSDSNLESGENVPHKSADKLYQMLSESVLNRDEKIHKKSNKKSMKDRLDKVLREESDSPVPSIIKSLLRISNDLRCAAQKECADACPKQAENAPANNKCEEKCEKKFDCPEPAEECNECAEPEECNSCTKKDSCESCGTRRRA